MALLSPHDPDNPDLIFEHLAGAPDGFYNAPLPESYSLRSAEMTARDQKSRGTCVAFATPVTAKLAKKMRVDLSPEWIYRHRQNPRTGGMYARDSLQILQRIGAVTEERCPYQDTDDPIDLDPKLYTEAKLNQVNGYTRVTTIDGVKRALLEQKVPLIAIVDHYNSSAEFWRPSMPNQRCNYHAVLIVGFNPTSFQLLNSWGKNWNTDGFTKLPYQDWPAVKEVWSVEP